METQTMPFNEFMEWFMGLEESLLPEGYTLCPMTSLSPPYVNCWLFKDSQIADLKQRSGA